MDADVTVSDVDCDAPGDAEGDGLAVATGDGLGEAFGEVLACGAGFVQPVSKAASMAMHKMTANNKDLTLINNLLAN